MSVKRFYCYMAGDSEPFLNTSKACYERFARALIETGSKLTSSYISNPQYKSWFIAAVEIPDGMQDLFKSIAKCSLQFHPDIKIGMNVSKSVKYYDEIIEPDAKGREVME